MKIKSKGLSDVGSRQTLHNAIANAYQDCQKQIEIRLAEKR